MSHPNRPSRLATYTLVCSSLEIHLVSANAETADAQQVLCFIQDSLGELCLGADADNVHISDFADQLIAHQSLSDSLDLEHALLLGDWDLHVRRFGSYLIALLLESIDSSGIDVLQQQDLDFGRLEGSQHLGLVLSEGRAARTGFGNCFRHAMCNV